MTRRKTIEYSQEALIHYLRSQGEGDCMKVVKNRIVKKASKKGIVKQFGALTIAFYLSKVYIIGIDFEMLESMQ